MRQSLCLRQADESDMFCSIHPRFLSCRRICRQHGRLAADLPHHIFVILAVWDPPSSTAGILMNTWIYLNNIYEYLIQKDCLFRSASYKVGLPLQMDSNKRSLRWPFSEFGMSWSCDEVIWVALMGYFIFGVVGAMWHESRILHRALLKASVLRIFSIGIHRDKITGTGYQKIPTGCSSESEVWSNRLAKCVIYCNNM